MKLDAPHGPDHLHGQQRWCLRCTEYVQVLAHESRGDVCARETRDDRLKRLHRVQIICCKKAFLRWIMAHLSTNPRRLLLLEIYIYILRDIDNLRLRQYLLYTLINVPWVTYLSSHPSVKYLLSHTFGDYLPCTTLRDYLRCPAYGVLPLGGVEAGGTFSERYHGKKHGGF